MFKRRSVSFKAYEIIERAVESGVAFGWHRAWKHVDEGGKPNDDAAIGTITDEVTNSLCEVLRFD